METIYQQELTGAGMWSAVIGRHKRLRITTREAGANVGMMLYHAAERHERYNMPDTLKGQHIFYLRAPYCLHSDMGRLLASITADSVGWHDTVCGHSGAALVKSRYGEKNFQQARNDWHRNARDCFLIELAKWGLGKRDLISNINWFSKVTCDEDGRLTFDPDHAPAGAVVELRFELETLVVINACQHPLDPCTTYHPRSVSLEVLEGPPTCANDPSFLVRPENGRAWENNQRYHQLRF